MDKWRDWKRGVKGGWEEGRIREWLWLGDVGREQLVGGEQRFGGKKGGGIYLAPEFQRM